MAMTPALQMAGLAAEQLQWAEDHHHWNYMEKLAALLQAMGAKIIHLNGGYVVEFVYDRPLPNLQDTMRRLKGP